MGTQAGRVLPAGRQARGRCARLEKGKEELHAALAELESVLAGSSPGDRGTIRLDGDDHLVVPPLPAEDIPSEARELKDELAGMLPFAPIASLLIELDARTGFLDCFTHAGGRKLAKSAETKRNILAVLIAMATNLELGRMSEACGGSYDVLAWTRCSAAASCRPPTAWLALRRNSASSIGATLSMRP